MHHHYIWSPPVCCEGSRSHPRGFRRAIYARSRMRTSENTLPRNPVNRDQRAIERAVRMAATVSSGASKGTKCPALGTNRKSRLGKVCSIPSAQDGGLIGSSSPHLTTVGMSMGESRRVLLVG